MTHRLAVIENAVTMAAVVALTGWLYSMGAGYFSALGLFLLLNLNVYGKQGAEK
jgi:hypothetical protein